MNDMMNALTITLPSSRRYLQTAAHAVANNPGPSVPQPKETNMSILKVWREHRQRLIKPCLRKY